VNAHFSPAVAADGDNGIGIPEYSHFWTDYTLLEGSAEVFIQDIGMLIQKTGIIFF
jgi:hypothetical protein